MVVVVLRTKGGISRTTGETRPRKRRGRSPTTHTATAAALQSCLLHLLQLLLRHSFIHKSWLSPRQRPIFTNQHIFFCFLTAAASCYFPGSHRHHYHKNGKEHIEKNRSKLGRKCSVFHAPTVMRIRTRTQLALRYPSFSSETFKYILVT